MPKRKAATPKKAAAATKSTPKRQKAAKPAAKSASKKVEQKPEPEPEDAPDAAAEDETELTLEDVRSTEELIKAGKKNHNQIVTLLDLIDQRRLETKSVAVVLGAEQTLRRAFSALAKSGDLKVVAPKLAGKPSPAEQYAKWLRGLYKRYTGMLLLLVRRQDVRLQAAAFHSLMDCVRVEWSETASPDSKLYSQIILCLLTHPFLAQAVRDDFVTKFLKVHTDLRYYGLKNIKSILDKDFDSIKARLRVVLPSEGVGAKQEVKGSLQATTPDTFAANSIDLLLRVKLPASEVASFFALPLPTAKAKKAVFELGKQATLLSDAWVAALRLPLPEEVYKLVLVHLHKHVLPLLQSPLLLSDFLTDAYNIGGVVSLLALDGLFVLITKHNLDYPHFYPKLYSLCKPHMMHAKYSNRFFTLLALSLTSGHIPSYMAAAFAKRLARLALTAPPAACVFLTTAVCNLLRRHPSCRTLVHRPPKAAKFDPAGDGSSTFSLLAAGGAPPTSGDNDALQLTSIDEQEEEEEEEEEDEGDEGEEEGDESDEEEEEEVEAAPPGQDPFDAEEDNPAKCRAGQSSLWEMKSLTNHYCPQVSRMAKELFAGNAMKSKDYDVKAAVAHSYSSLFSTELAWRKNQKSPLAYEKPVGLFGASEDALFAC